MTYKAANTVSLVSMGTSNYIPPIPPDPPPAPVRIKKRPMIILPRISLQIIGASRRGPGADHTTRIIDPESED